MRLAARLRRLALLGFLAATAFQLSGCSSAEDRARSYFEKGSEYAGKGEPIKAMLEFRNALRLKGDFLDAQFALGQALEQQGDYASAAKSYFAVAEQSPTDVPSRVRLSYILMAGAQLDEADRFAEEANKIAPDDPSVLVARAALALKRGDGETGASLAKVALAKQPGSTDALAVLASERLMASDPKGALAFLEQASTASERDIGLQMLRLAALDAAGDQPGVEQLFIKLIGLFPDTPSLRDGLTKWYIDKGRVDDAEATIRKFATENPGNEQAELQLVGFLNSQRGAGAAIDELKAVIAARSSGSDTFLFRQALAQLQFDTGAKSEALEGLKSLVTDTTDADKKNVARVQLARTLTLQGDSAAAAELAETVLATDARNVEALALRASLRLDSGAAEDAVQDLVAALNEAPDNANLHTLLALAYERAGSVVLAQEQYSKAADLGKYDAETGIPMARFLMRYGKVDQALRVLEEVRKQAPDNREVLSMLGDLKLSAQDWVGAQEVADTLRGLTTGSGAVADRIGAAALMGLKRYSESISLLQSSLSAGGRGEVLPDLIGAYVRSGKPEVAEAYLGKILATTPDDSQALILLGSVYMTEGKREPAEAALKKAAANSSDTRGDVALVQYYVATGNTAAAESAAAVGLKQDPGNSALGLLLADIYEKSERFDDAIAEYEKLYERDPSSNVVANGLASMLSDRRQDSASLERAYEIAKRLSGSEIPQYLDTLGWIYHIRGDFASALPLLKTAAERLPNVGLVQYHLGVTLSELGQTDLAKESLGKAMAATPPLLEADLVKVRQAIEKNEEKRATDEAKK